VLAQEIKVQLPKLTLKLTKN